MNESKKRFPVVGCLASVIIMIAGGTTCGFMIYMAVVSLSGGLTQFAVPGGTELQLTETGTYTIYHEHRSTFQGRTYSTMGQVSGLSIKVTEKAGGSEIAVVRPMGSSNYSIGGRQGFAVFTFSVQAPGTYVVSGQYPQGQAGTPAIFTVGKGIVGTMLLYMFGGFGVAGLSVLLALIITVVSLLRYIAAGKRAAGAA